MPSCRRFSRHLVDRRTVAWAQAGVDHEHGAIADDVADVGHQWDAVVRDDVDVGGDLAEPLDLTIGAGPVCATTGGAVPTSASAVTIILKDARMDPPLSCAQISCVDRANRIQRIWLQS